MIDKLLSISLEQGWVITIIYQKGNTITKRNIKVLENNKDTIKAFCYLRNALRIFQKDSILAADYLRERNRV